eukprot:266365-Hanusia_phi.AAC.3
MLVSLLDQSVASAKYLRRSFRMTLKVNHFQILTGMELYGDFSTTDVYHQVRRRAGISLNDVSC